MRANKNNRMVKPRITHPRHCDQYLSTKVHLTTLVASHAPNMRNRAARLKRRLPW